MGHTTKSPAHARDVWHGGHFRCDNARCGFQADRDYVGAVNVARVFFSDSDSLDHDFTSSYKGDSEIVLARRSAGERRAASRSPSEASSDAGTRLTFGTAPIAYTGQSRKERVTAGGGSACIAPAVTTTETKTDSGNHSTSSPATLGTTRFVRVSTNCYRK